MGEDDTVRILHDATHHVKVNHRIRQRDQVRSPGFGELRAVLQRLKLLALMAIALVGDFRKAHRRVRVRQRDHGFQACRTRPGWIWVNAVGTYGVVSAG